MSAEPVDLAVAAGQQELQRLVRQVGDAVLLGVGDDRVGAVVDADQAVVGEPEQPGGASTRPTRLPKESMNSEAGTSGSTRGDSGPIRSGSTVGWTRSSVMTAVGELILNAMS